METKVYFKNINGLRFLASLCIVVHHIEQIKHTYGLPNYCYCVGDKVGNDVANTSLERLLVWD